MKALDACDREIAVGDLFARASDFGGRPCVEFGRVTRVYNALRADDWPTIEAVTVRRLYAPHLNKQGKPVSIQHLERLIILERIPGWAAKLLASVP